MQAAVQNGALIKEVGMSQISPPTKNNCQPAYLRTAGPQDGAAIVAMHRRLSNDSVYLRYLRPYRPSQAEIERMIRNENVAENSEQRALVAVAAHNPREVVGLAYYTRDPMDPRAAEPAVVVEDSWQNCGLGRELLDRLGHLAATNGLVIFRAHVLPSNVRILHMARQNPRLRKMHYADGLMVIETGLQP